MAFYQVVMNGQYLGQDVKSMLYYRTGVGVDVSGLAIGGAEALANTVKTDIWEPAWKKCVSQGYTLESIDVYAFNQLLQLMYTLPAHVNVGEAGEWDGNGLPPSAYILMKFGFDAQVIGNNLIAPKRGHIKIGGLTENQQDAGRLNGTTADQFIVGTARHRFNQLANKLASNIESILPPVIWFPIRVKRLPTGVYTGWADVANCTYDDRILSLRSRQLED